MSEASALRAFSNKMLHKYAGKLAPASVLNIGAVPDLPDKQGRLYRDYFPKAEWFTADKRAAAGNHYQVDLMDVTGIDRTFDLILNIAVLEHVVDPFKVSANLKSLLNPGGYMFVTVPFFYGRHGTSYGDYWRFTDDALRLLYGDLIEVEIKPSPKNTGYVGVFLKA